MKWHIGWQWIFLLGGGIFSFASYAFTLIRSDTPRFSNPKVYIDVTDVSCPSLGTPEEILDLTIEAVNQYWNQIPTCALELHRGHKTDGDFSNLNISSKNPDLETAFNQLNENNRILVGCSSENIEANILAAGVHLNNKGIVIINASPLSSFHFQTREQKKAILAHEIGHTIGLGHSGDPISLMYYTVDGKIQERLSLDDYDGCTYLYPHESPSCSGIPYINPGKNGTSSSGGKSNHHMLFSFLLGILLSMGIFVLLKKTDLTKRLPW